MNLNLPRNFLFALGLVPCETDMVIMDPKSALRAALACSLLWAGACVAQDSDDADATASVANGNPYSIIPERNVFHLNPPPPPPAPPEPPKADLPTIKITGIVKIGDQVRALFVGETKDKKEGPTYYNLAAGERQGILEVVRIDPVGQKVDIVNSGTSATLTVKEDSLAKSEGTPPPGANPPNGAPGQRQPPQFPGFGNRRLPAPAFPGSPVPGTANPNSPFPVPMRTRRTSFPTPPAPEPAPQAQETAPEPSPVAPPDNPVEPVSDPSQEPPAPPQSLST